MNLFIVWHNVCADSFFTLFDFIESKQQQQFFVKSMCMLSIATSNHLITCYFSEISRIYDNQIIKFTDQFCILVDRVGFI